MKVADYPEHRLRALKLPKECDSIIQNLMFMSGYKFDNYELYRPGNRFLGHLIPWLQQFSPKERIVALKLIDRLIYISEPEMQSLAFEPNPLLDNSSCIMFASVAFHVRARIVKP